MRRLIHHIATSADGFIAERGGSLARFAQDGQAATEYLAALAHYGAVVMGRVTYDLGRTFGVLDPYPHLDTYVFSRTLEASPHPHVNATAEDPREVVLRLKSEGGGPIYLCGGGQLAGLLFGAGLVDEVILKVNPFLAGDGVRLLGGVSPGPSLALRSSQTHPEGIIVSHYDVRR